VAPAVDQVTRFVTLRASIKGAGKRLRPGMFLNVKVLLDEERDSTQCDDQRDGLVTGG
jgi:hypothetical protein